MLPLAEQIALAEQHLTEAQEGLQKAKEAIKKPLEGYDLSNAQNNLQQAEIRVTTLQKKIDLLKAVPPEPAMGG
jgi:hypothetical protein